MQTRAIYDDYGEYALKHGIITAQGGKISWLLLNKLFIIEKIGGTYFMQLNPESLFDKILGRKDPWTT